MTGKPGVILSKQAARGTRDLSVYLLGVTLSETDRPAQVHFLTTVYQHVNIGRDFLRQRDGAQQYSVTPLPATIERRF